MRMPPLDLRASAAVARAAGHGANQTMAFAQRVGPALPHVPPLVVAAPLGSAENALNGAVGGAISAAFFADLAIQPVRWVVGFDPERPGLYAHPRRLAHRQAARALPPAGATRARGRAPADGAREAGASSSASTSSSASSSASASASSSSSYLGPDAASSSSSSALPLAASAADDGLVDRAVAVAIAVGLFPYRFACRAWVVGWALFGAWVGVIRGFMASLPAGGLAVRRAVSPPGNDLGAPYGLTAVQQGGRHPRAAAGA